MSLLEYMQYLKLEISSLRRQLADAIAHRNLYEPLLQEYLLEKEQPPEEPPTMPDKPMGFFEWLRSKSSLES